LVRMRSPVRQPHFLARCLRNPSTSDAGLRDNSQQWRSGSLVPVRASLRLRAWR
jgi:hypothetical protein